MFLLYLFFVDPEILEDPNAKGVQAITLSYTFFHAEEDTATEMERINKGSKIGSTAEQRRRSERDSG